MKKMAGAKIAIIIKVILLIKLGKTVSLIWVVNFLGWKIKVWVIDKQPLSQA